MQPEQAVAVEPHQDTNLARFRRENHTLKLTLGVCLFAMATFGGIAAWPLLMPSAKESVAPQVRYFLEEKRFSFTWANSSMVADLKLAWINGKIMATLEIVAPSEAVIQQLRSPADASRPLFSAEMKTASGVTIQRMSFMPRMFKRATDRGGFTVIEASSNLPCPAAEYSEFATATLFAE
jgi:hypothetical protein